MENNEKFMVPRTNLAESVHGSWLASNDGVHYISLYNACQGDLMTTLLQQSKYDSFLKGGHKGSGPGIQQIKKRQASMSSNLHGPSNIIDITNEAAVELDATRRRLSTDGGPCKLILCNPNEVTCKGVDRGVMHLGYHMHPVGISYAPCCCLQKELIDKH